VNDINDDSNVFQADDKNRYNLRSKSAATKQSVAPPPPPPKKTVVPAK